jgi:hypothetical protein
VHIGGTERNGTQQELHHREALMNQQCERAVQ